MELLVVIAIISVLLVAIVPAVNSLSKSNSRKGAISNLMAAIEQARSQAIREGQSMYVVFPTTLPGNPDTAMIQRYSYKSYAIFKDNPATGVATQVTPWRTIPSGVSLRSKVDTGTDKHGAVDTLPTGVTFGFQPTAGSATFPYIKFNANGELEAPPNNVVLVVFEGYVDTGAEVITGAKDAFGNPKTAEALNISHLTGRAEPTITPTPSS